MTVVRRDVKFDEEKAMRCSLERELQIPPEEELLAPNKEAREVVEQLQVEEKIVETSLKHKHIEKARKEPRKLIDLCRILERALYGLKQAPCAWYTKIDNYLTNLGFTKSEANENLYHILVEGELLIIFLYVDDLILVGDEQLIKSYKEDLAKEFEMKDMGLMHYFLELEVWKSDEELFVSQGKYANEIIQIFCMESCKPMEISLATHWRKEDSTSGEEVDTTIYLQLEGSLLYLVNTRPEMCYAVNQWSQAMVRPTKLFWKATKHVLRYLKATT
eukprot:PITA_03039